MKGTILVMIALSVSACGGSELYQKEKFSKDSIYRREYQDSASKVCEAAESVLLGSGYLLVQREGDAFTARKEFQPEKESNETIEFGVVCRDEAGKSVLYANAVETRNQLKKSTQSASIGLPAAGSISFPWSKSVEALIKVGGKTIDDRRFYARFFDAVESLLKKR